MNTTNYFNFSFPVNAPSKSKVLAFATTAFLEVS